MFKGFNNRQQNGFPKLNFQGDRSAYGQVGCSMWMRADFGLNTQTNNAAISSWVDSITGIPFVQATAGSQPRLNLTNANYNNLPTVDFFDNARFLTTQNETPISNIKTIAFIANYDTINIVNRLCGSLGTTQSVGLGGTQAGVNGVFFGDSSTIYSGTTENTNVKICVISDSLIMVNGVAESTNPAVNIQFSINTIGQSLALTGGRLIGKVAEIIGFSTSLNQAQALALSTQLNQKYVIY